MVAPVKTLIDEYLEEQQRLQTPVARFSDTHGKPALEPVYRDLIPLSAPQPGEQYAFEVDLDACTGCKACVAGCHALNGLDDTEAWRDVGLITGLRADGSAYQQTVTTACHHCADPGCLNGCPVLAYEKDPRTGIVRHLDDQCIGCQYCILQCPYDVPKYNERLGIVRKCDLCHGRLAEGEAPACVQACPTHAIRIVTVPTNPATRTADTSAFLAAAPSPAHTQPTTRYLSARRPPATTRAADADLARIQPAHSPLAALLVLTQLALGLQLAALLVTYYVTTAPAALPDLVTYYVTSPPAPSADKVTYYVTRTPAGGPELVTQYVTLLAGAVGLAAVGLLVSIGHLGQPWRAWRVFLNLRRSWLSREAVVFGAWFGVLVLPLALRLPLPAWLAAMEPVRGFRDLLGSLVPTLLVVGAGLGFTGVGCSAMIYVDTNRRAWRAPFTFGRFFGTVLVGAGLGLGPLSGAAAALVKLGIDLLAHRRGPAAGRALAAGKLRLAFRLRWFFGLAGTLLLLGAALLDPGAWLPGAVVVIAGEFAERSLFFRAVDGSKMPGTGAA